MQLAGIYIYELAGTVLLMHPPDQCWATLIPASSYIYIPASCILNHRYRARPLVPSIVTLANLLTEIIVLLVRPEPSVRLMRRRAHHVQPTRSLVRS